MAALVLNGSRRAGDMTDRVYSSVLEALAEEGIANDAFVLRETHVAHCLGCFGCWTETPGICVIDDGGRDVTKAAVGKDLIIITPVTFGGYSSELKKVLDRSVPLVSPLFTWVSGEVHHVKRYDWAPRIVAVGILETDDEESRRVFENLVRRNAINFRSSGTAVGFVTASVSAGELKATLTRLLAEAGVAQ